MRFDLTPADVIRLRSLGVRIDGDIANPPSLKDELERRCEAYHQAMLMAIESERRAWREARRWRAWGWMGLACAAASLAATLLAAIARRGAW